MNGAPVRATAPHRLFPRPHAASSRALRVQKADAAPPFAAASALRVRARACRHSLAAGAPGMAPGFAGAISWPQLVLSAERTKRALSASLRRSRSAYPSKSAPTRARAAKSRPTNTAGRTALNVAPAEIGRAHV